MTTPTDPAELYAFVAALGDVVTPMSALYNSAQQALRDSASFLEQVPENLTELLQQVGPVRALEETFHDAINAPDPIDPIEVFATYEPVYNQLLTAKDSFSRYTGLQSSAQDLNEQATQQMTQFIAGLPDMKQRLTDVMALFDDWTPDEES